MFLFHSDGTMQQSNPDAGDANSSDSSGLGVWRSDGSGGVQGKFVEITADRATRQFGARGEIAFSLRVDGDALQGTLRANFFDAGGRLVRGPISVPMEGQRVVP